MLPPASSEEPSSFRQAGSPVRSFRHFHQLDSTNRWAVEHGAEFSDEQLPLLVLADHQTAGRGRGDRSWHADAGTLTFSLLEGLKRLQLQRATASRIALVAGLSVAEAIESFVPPLSARIKWPNDVQVAGRKVCGILVEAAGSAVDRVVIGIGVNVSTDFSTAAEDVRQRAGSLAEIANRPLARNELLELLVERLAENTARMAEEFPELIAAIRQRCLLSGKQVTLQRGRESLRGWCRGIDEAGALRIDDGHTVHHVESGEIVRLV
ncbi:biotin--[acetyl-CoA-carboxylase] ligase [Candidatus Laterigemmans baculatus]|uniref:biotin--[acetyl-CoA-carboxylase] ligase n=1 Tax=Candidatus Laterigemmans baculatus TaxID=2770505 RepID=UPI0013D9771C|nr:biotin--[acetyl-CoA-carboxylase] ligase [Candidatus Laterigemmans baculatus]